MKVIDMHAHIHLLTPDVEVDKRRIMRTIEKFNIEEVHVSALSAHKPSEDEVTLLNKDTAQFVKEEPGRIKGAVYISPEHKNAVEVLKRGIEEQDMSSAKIWVSEKCDSPAVNPIAEKLIEYNLPLLIHSFKKSTIQVANESTAVEVRNLALRYPELKIIMAHVGGNCYHGVPLVRDLKNVWVDISGSPNRSNEVEYTVENLGADRVLFGTDMPGASFLVLCGKVLESGITDEEKEKIFYKNALQVYDKNFKI